MRGMLLLLAGVCITGRVRAEGDFVRLAADAGSGLVHYDVSGSLVTWTSAVPAVYSVEVDDGTLTNWLPVAYGSNNTLTATTPVPRSRSYRLGFTPFPYAIGTNAADWIAIMDNVYGFLATNADITGHHFDAGVPWPEALAGDPFPAAMESDLQYRKAMTPPHHVIYLALTPIHLDRNQLAPYRGESESMPLPPPWDTYTFDHPDVREAYYQYCRRMITFFEPSYVVIGIEVNLLLVQAPSLWSAYYTLHTGTYARLKMAFTNLPIAVSLTGMDLLEGYTGAIHTQQLAAVDALTNQMDFYGLSFHTIISALLADTVPSTGMISEVLSLVHLPVAICETSYPAEPFAIQGGSLIFNGSTAKQEQYFKNLFTVLDGMDSRFVINFVPIDYDALWQAIGEPDDLNKLWRDTGLIDESLNERPALRIWRGKLGRPVR